MVLHLGGSWRYDLLGSIVCLCRFVQLEPFDCAAFRHIADVLLLELNSHEVDELVSQQYLIGAGVSFEVGV